jgi:hypothetical protein
MNLIDKLFGNKTSQRVRLSDTKEIQTAYRQALQGLCDEVRATEFIGGLPEGTINGAELLKSFDSLRPDTLTILGFKTEHVRVMKALTSLLAQCARLEGTKTNIAIVEHLFHPVKPTTALVADACEEVISAFTESIG